MNTNFLPCTYIIVGWSYTLRQQAFAIYCDFTHVNMILFSYEQLIFCFTSAKTIDFEYAHCGGSKGYQQSLY